MTPNATCPTCDHPAADHQSGDGPWTGWCGVGLGTDEACECEGPGHEHLDFVTWQEFRPGSSARQPVCGFCGLLLERAGDAIVVPA